MIELKSNRYFREENVLFLCCLIIAIAVERSNVHRRIALRILMSGGTNYGILIPSIDSIDTCSSNSASMVSSVNTTSVVNQLITRILSMLKRWLPPFGCSTSRNSSNYGILILELMCVTGKN